MKELIICSDMMTKYKLSFFKQIVIISIIIFAATVSGIAQNLSGPIPQDPTVRTGKLPNGMTYYIKKNVKPEKRAELRLVVNAGSILEDDDQLGLAHFNEHMAFSGTKNFKKDDLVNFLQTCGIKWGEDLNAYTSFDETVFKLTVPTDSEHVFDKGIQVIEDWAHNVSFDSTQIERERGIVISELRLGLGPFQRMYDSTYPIQMKGSHYAERRTIGKLDILQHSTDATLKRFYEDWYRPDLMAVIVVGDFDIDRVEKMIKEKFSRIPSKTDMRPRILYPVPDTKELLIAKATDKEAPYTSVEIDYKHEKQTTKTLSDLRRSIIYDLYNSMLNNRLQELQKSSTPPFLFGFAYIGELTRTKDAYQAWAYVNQKGIEKGIETLVTENERIRRFGFTSTELEREKKDVLRNKETQLQEKDKTESEKYVETYISAYLDNQPLPGIEYEYEPYKKNMDAISLDEVNQVAKDWITPDGENAVIVLNGPKNDSLVMPSDEKIRKIFNNATHQDLKPYDDKTSNKPLMAVKPTPGKVINEKKIDSAGITEWELSNGVKIVLKPTDFKNDEIVFSASRWGGASLYPDKDYMSASFSSDIVHQSGVGEFDATTLQKMLSGKIINVFTYVGDINIGIEGQCSPKDMETALQLINLYMTQPRKDEAGYKAALSQMQGFIENQSNLPEAVFYDSLRYAMANYNFRRRPYSTKTLNEVNFDRAFEIYKESFSDANGLVFCFVGNMEPEKLKPLIETYLGGLPSTKTIPTWKDEGITLPQGVVNKTIAKGTDPNSNIAMVFSGAFTYSSENKFDMDALNALLNIKVIEQVRMKMGLVYAANAYDICSHYPKQEYQVNITISGAAPEKVNALISATLTVIDSVKQFGINATDLKKVKETLLRQRETDLKDNQFWINAIAKSYQDNENPTDVMNYNKQVEQLSGDDFKQWANQYLHTNNYATFTLKPEKQ